MVCPHCSSLYVIKEGIKKTRKAIKQKYMCHSCGRWFSVPLESRVKDYTSNEIKAGEVFHHQTEEVCRVHCLTDIHVGAKEFDLDKFKEAVNTIASDPQAVWFGNGDMIELIPPGYKAISTRGQTIPPEEQYLSFLQLVAPIRDKCLFIRGGNHDFLRSYLILDFDVCKVIAAELGVPYYKYPGYARIKIKTKKKEIAWNIVSGHGKSGAKNGDLELDRLAAVYSEGDVFILGHNHQLYAKPVDSLRIDGDKEVLHRRWYVRGGSFMMYADYARYSLYPIVRTGWVTIELSQDGIKCWEN